MLSAVYAVVVCLCVCVSVTLRYCIKTAKRRITQTTPHDSPMTLEFFDAKDHDEIRTGSDADGVG